VDWNYSWAPKLETAPGQLVALAVGINEMCHAVDVDHAHVLLGADFYRFCSADGAPAGLRPIAEGAYRVKQSPDGRLAVAALFDGTVRWFRLDDGLEELLAVFVTDEPSPRWVAFTPDGYYAAGVGAEDLIGWHLDRAPRRGAGLVMLDTCYAGAAGQPLPDWAPDTDRLMNLLRSAGVPVFGATAANARAQERVALRNGIFTHALLKVLDRPDRSLPFSELWTALRREVGAATGQRQDVSFLNAGVGTDFALLAGVG
jgi:hypothetical protein